MTDGDNLQWTLGPWSVDTRWYGSPDRGKVPCGWTLSPAIADLSPASLASILESKTDNDEFIAGPSGFGYVYPTTWPRVQLDAFAEVTQMAMKKAGMPVCNILGQNNDAPVCTEIDPLLTENGAIFYPWGDGYAGLRGKVYFCGGKPVVSGRFSLWGDAKTGDMVDVDGLVANLKAMPEASVTSTGAYSLIPVHAWSHTYEDIVSVVEALQEDGRFDVVTPSELLLRVKVNVKPGH
jgi:hypothetical protein